MAGGKVGRPKLYNTEEERAAKEKQWFEERRARRKQGIRLWKFFRNGRHCKYETDEEALNAKRKQRLEYQKRHRAALKAEALKGKISKKEVKADPASTESKESITEKPSQEEVPDTVQQEALSIEEPASHSETVVSTESS